MHFLYIVIHSLGVAQLFTGEAKKRVEIENTMLMSRLKRSVAITIFPFFPVSLSVAYKFQVIEG